VTSRLANRLRRVEERAGLVDEVEAILNEVNIWHTDALLLQLIAFIEDAIAAAAGEHVTGGPSDEMLRTSHLGTRAKYETALAEIPPGTFERLLAAFVARAGADDLHGNVLAQRDLNLRRSLLTRLFPDEDIIGMAR
jgi:hypothetical protein